ncbi:MAG: hypothetical protein NXH81_07285 [Halieaceae bacterium]|uniref:hypothetical protein n=1 Tax=Haliea alexandrii TaxID=2448162 RepID=UPI000F0B1E9D|nr:hypothetical protein [Haliea alexandrii]MCR9185181.1 hypothetical protein [Halieaceae bacterium]
MNTELNFALLAVLLSTIVYFQLKDFRTQSIERTAALNRIYEIAARLDHYEIQLAISGRELRIILMQEHRPEKLEEAENLHGKLHNVRMQILFLKADLKELSQFLDIKSDNYEITGAFKKAAEIEKKSENLLEEAGIWSRRSILVSATNSKQ